MTNETYQKIKGAMYYDDNIKKYVYKEDLPQDIRESLIDIQRGLGASFEISYAIMNDALGLLPETLEEVDNYDPYDDSDEIGSVYTTDRLAYLDINNQYDIAQILKECNCEDIATACAIWYERMVRECVSQLDEYINL